MALDLLDALVQGKGDIARALATHALPQEFEAEALELFAMRRDQATRVPDHEPWLLRAIVLRETREMVGYANFHGPPGINDTGAPNAVSIGYEVFPEHRGRGYATEAASELLEWAEREHGVTHVVCGVAPGNAASMRVLEKLAFRRTALVVDGEVIFERRR